MDMITAKLSANMAISELVENGQVGRADVKKQTAAEPFVYPAGKNGVDGIKANYEYLIEEATYIVTIDGVEYKTVGRHNGYPIFFIGNELLVDGNEDTGEPFGIELPDDGNLNWSRMVLKEKPTEDTHVTIELVEETVQPIDPKYLPNPADLPASWVADLKTALGLA